MFRRLARGVALLLVVGMIAACGKGTDSAASGEKVIKIGLFGDESGASAKLGFMQKFAAELAVEEINKAGGIKGAKIQVFRLDDAADPDKSRTAFTRLVEQEKVVLVLGPTNSHTAAATQVLANQKKVAMIGTLTANSKLTENQPYFFRGGALADRYQMNKLANYAVQTKGYKKIALLHDTNAYGVGLRDDLTKYLKDQNVTPVTIEQYTFGDNDFKAQLLKIKAKEPDFLAILGTAKEGGKIAQQAREVGLTVQFGGGSGILTADFLALAGKSGEGTVATGGWLATDTRPESKAFIDKFKPKAGEVPDGQAAQVYDLFFAVKKALENADLKLTADSLEKDREAVFKALPTLKDFKGLTGLKGWGPNPTPEDRDANKDPVIGTVKDGVFVPVQ